jgi:hypothetical protein
LRPDRRQRVNGRRSVVNQAAGRHDADAIADGIVAGHAHAAQITEAADAPDADLGSLAQRRLGPRAMGAVDSAEVTDPMMSSAQGAHAMMSSA